MNSLKYRSDLLMLSSAALLASACSAHVSGPAIDMSQIPGITPQSNAANVPSSNSGNSLESTGASSAPTPTTAESANAAASANAALQGKWVQGCSKIGNLDLYATTEYDFSGLTYTSTQTTYVDSTCSPQSIAPFNSTSGDFGTFSVPAPGKINLNSVQYEYRDYYSVYEIKNGMLYLGIFSGTESGRPTSLSYGFPFNYGGTTQLMAASAIQGKWVQPCMNADGSGESIKSEYDFNDIAYTYTQTTYSDSTCTTQATSLVDSGTYSVPASGQINLISTQNGVAKSYTIYVIYNGVLFLGNLSDTEAGRPTSLSYDVTFNYSGSMPPSSLTPTQPQGAGGSQPPSDPATCTGAKDWQSAVGAACSNQGSYSFFDFGTSRITQPETLTITIYDGNGQKQETVSNPTVQRSSSSQFSIDFGYNSNGIEMLMFNKIDTSAAPPYGGSYTTLLGNSGFCAPVSSGNAVSCYKAVKNNDDPDNDQVILP